jgi:hypothetical protein
MEMLDNSPNAWEREVAAYTAADTLTQMPNQPIVVVGGQRARLWHDLQDVLAPRPVLMRGLGDAIVEDITFNYSQLIGFYQPDTVVLLLSNSEFFLRDNKSAEELVAAVVELAELDASFGITQRFYVFTPLKTLLRQQDYATIDQATQLLTSWAATDERVTVLDANALFSGPDDKPRANYFRGDGINLNEHGYLRLSVLLHSQLEAENRSQL